MLSNNDLASYFLSNNLPISIVNERGFLQEGEWEVCVTAFAIVNGEQVSDQSCYYLFLEDLDPPIIIMPLDSIMPAYPQNVQFYLL